MAAAVINAYDVALLLLERGADFRLEDRKSRTVQDIMIATPIDTDTEMYRLKLKVESRIQGGTEEDDTE
ncbi:MAG: hypothetical protein E1N59_2645 [Puniceicoccaceae bacterium 5H]|nr:MAG: hypothetical protein E1N59_2645 [Puniceicoccaceae bacterium 5H]